MNVTSFFNKNQVWIIGVVIFCVNLISKLFFFSEYPLWYDEVYTLHTALLSISDITYVCNHDVSAPFYYFIVHYWVELFGIDEFSLRFLSVIFNLLAVLSLYLFVNRHFNLQSAIIACVLFITSNSLFYYAQEVRVYSFLVFIAIVSSWSFFELVFSKKWWALFFLAMFNYCGIFSHYLFVLIPFIQFVLVILLCNRKSLLLFGVSGVISLFMMKGWLERMFEVFISGGNASFQSYDSTKLLLDLLGGLWSIALMLTFVISGIYFMLYKRKDFNESNLFKLFYLLLWSFAILKITHLAGKSSSVYVPRYLLFILPSFFVLVGYFYSFIPKNKLLKGGLIFLTSLVGVFNMSFVIDKGMNYQKLVEKVKSLKDDRTLVIVQSKDMVSTFMYYYHRTSFEDITKLSDNLYRHNILLADNISDIENIDLSPYNKVCLSQTYQEITDPNNSIVNFLQKKFVTDSLIHDISGASLHIYTGNKNYDPTEKMMNERGELSQVQIMINNIKSNEEWYNQVIQKAEEWGLTVDSVLKLDAIYTIEHSNK